jgi:hypothetical protein
MSDPEKYKRLINNEQQRIAGDMGRKRKEDAVGKDGSHVDAAEQWERPIQNFAASVEGVQASMNGHAEGVVFMLLEENAAKMRNLLETLRESGELSKLIEQNSTLDLPNAIKHFEDDVTMKKGGEGTLSHSYGVSSLRAKSCVENSSKTEMLYFQGLASRSETYVRAL